MTDERSSADIASDRKYAEELLNDLAWIKDTHGQFLCVESWVKKLRAIAPAQAASEPVARAHITLEDDGPYARLEVLNGERLQPSMSPVDLYVEPPVGWSMTPLGRPVYTPPPVQPSSAGTEDGK